MICDFQKVLENATPAHLDLIAVMDCKNCKAFGGNNEACEAYACPAGYFEYTYPISN